MRKGQVGWVTCLSCGKRTYPSRARAKLNTSMLPTRHVYKACGGRGWHVTTEAASRYAYFKDASSVQTVADIPADVLAHIEPRILDLRAEGTTIVDIAMELGLPRMVVNVVLREHDPLAEHPDWTRS